MGTKLRASLLSAAVAISVALPFEGQSQVNGNNYFTVKQAKGAPTVSLGGTVIPYKEVTLAAQLPGRVKFLAGIEGDAFEKGSVLVSLDDSELLAKRNSALAQWANAESQLRAAGVRYSRELWSPQS